MSRPRPITDTEAARIAATIARPADGSPAACTTVEGKFRIVWGHDGHRRPELVPGVTFDNPRDAAAVANALNAPRR